MDEDGIPEVLKTERMGHRPVQAKTAPISLPKSDIGGVRRPRLD